MKMPDPLAGINARKAQQALTHLLSASDAFKNSQSSPASPAPQGQDTTDPPADTSPKSSSNLEVARNSLVEALRLTNSVLVY